MHRSALSGLRRAPDAIAVSDAFLPDSDSSRTSGRTAVTVTGGNFGIDGTKRFTGRATI